MKRRPFAASEVAAKFESYEPGIRESLLDLRELIFETAAANGAMPLTETLKWDQPAYLTTVTKTGTTIRIDALRDGRGFGLFVHCQTTLVDRYRHLFGDAFEYDANRGLLCGITQMPVAKNTQAANYKVLSNFPNCSRSAA